ncbi:MAG: hypothetical protein JXQ72_10035, partial [Anaerolineae bacterium]|nr:hypothetical protein [Anaerolineae bacterium]
FFNRCAPLIRAAVTPEAVACYRIHAAHKTGSGGGPRWDEILGVYDQHLTGDDRRALARVRPWLGLIRWLKRLSRRYGRFGLYYGWRLALNMIRRAVIDRDPPLHPDMIALLELPYPTESRAQTLRRGAVCDGTVAGALAAFEPGSEPELS